MSEQKLKNNIAIETPVTPVFGPNNQTQYLPETLNIRNFNKGIYQIHFSDRIGYYFSKISDKFLLPPKEKIYSNDNSFIDHVLTMATIENNKDMNIILQGKKGLGKSFTGKIIANEISEKFDCPIIIVDKNVDDIGYRLEYLNNMKSKFILFLDEFEKIFPENIGNKNNDINYQNLFLSFLDGTSHINHGKIIIATSNERLNSYFYNRPSRFRYVRKYMSLSMELVNEIIDKHLINKKYKQDLLSNILPTCNIDVLEQIITEVNIFDKPYSEFKSFFNHSNESGVSVDYELIYNENIKFEFKLNNYLDEDHTAGYCSNAIPENITLLLKPIAEECILKNKDKYPKLFEKNKLSYVIGNTLRIDDFNENTNTVTWKIVVYSSDYDYEYNVVIKNVPIRHLIKFPSTSQALTI